jgi:transposase
MVMRTTTLEERMMILNLAQTGHSDREIAQRLGWKLSTVRKWRRRGQKEGRTALVSKMGRPASGTMNSFPPGVRETVRALRQAHPGWGPLTLYLELETEPSLAGQELPSRPTIARWLKQEGLTRPYERHQDLPQPPPRSAYAPHEAWEMDAQGRQKVSGVGVVSLINLNDRFSKVKLLSYPCWLGEQRANRFPNTQDYQLAFRLAATQWGLPDRLYVDRDSVFHDNHTPSPFPTPFHSWLTALGVELVFGPPFRPQERGMTERSHQTWDKQVLEGQSFAHWKALWQALQQRRHFLNERLPCSTLGNVPPLVAHPEARHPRRLYRPEWEAELLDLSRLYQYLSQGRWFRKASNVGAVGVSQQHYVLGIKWARKEVEITFDPADQHLVFYSPALEKSKRLPIKGITKTDLMGQLGSLAQMDEFQLALPFTWAEWQVIQLCEILDDTS